MENNEKIEILRTFKQLLNSVLVTNKLAKSMVGTVTSIKPLTVKISDKISISYPMLIIPRHLTDYETKITINCETGSEILASTNFACGDCPHTHELSTLPLLDTKAIIHNSLKVGDKVHLIQNQGGNEYIILDRMVD